MDFNEMLIIPKFGILDAEKILVCFFIKTGK